MHGLWKKYCRMQIITENYFISLREKSSEQLEFYQWLKEKKYSSIFVLVDENTKHFCYPLIENSLPKHIVLQIRSGEKEKNIDTCKYLWEELTKNKAERKSVLINLGGGVIGDMGGFVAGTYKRGFDFINIPTTLLAMVDASIGGKLGIDLNGIKNLIGLFGDPKMVIICSEFLKTLPKEQLRSGYAEILKHGLIKDKFYWEKIKRTDLNTISDLKEIITTSVNIKKGVVETDPFEAGVRKILNFGHTIGHAVETWSLQHDEVPLLHGEAIAIGMVCEAWLSHNLISLQKTDLEDIANTIFRFYPKYALDKLPINTLMEHMLLDKKNNNEKIQFSLLKSIGDCTYDIQAADALIADSIKYYAGL